MRQLLLVEDDLLISRSLAELLRRQHWECVVVRSLRDAESFLQKNLPQGVLLDLGLPDGDGLELLERLAASHPQLPVIVISGRSSVNERISGLRKGADEYLVKPYSSQELLLRLENVLSKVKFQRRKFLEAAGMQIYPDQGVVQFRGQNHSLRKREVQILSLLARHKNQVISRETIIENLWPEETIPTYATIDVYVRRIRMALKLPDNPIQTVRGFGYVLKDKAIKPYRYSAERT